MSVTVRPDILRLGLLMAVVNRDSLARELGFLANDRLFTDDEFAQISTRAFDIADVQGSAAAARFVVKTRFPEGRE